MLQETYADEQTSNVDVTLPDIQVEDPGPVMPSRPVAGYQWMPRPEPSVGLPPGLEYLSSVNCVVLKQTFLDTSGKRLHQYAIFNKKDKNHLQQIYTAHATGQYGKDFVIHIWDAFQAEVLRVEKDTGKCDKNNIYKYGDVVDGQGNRLCSHKDDDIFDETGF